MKSSDRKSRLSALLGRREREEFTRLLLTDVLHVLAKTRLLESAYVVSPDDEILDLASETGSRTLKEEGDRGVNAAVDRALQSIRGPSWILVLPSDLPLLKVSEVQHFLALKSQGLDVGIAPSRAFDGTNALLFSTRSRPPLSYDVDSFWNHLSAAARVGLSVGVCTEPGLTFDIDSPDDFRVLARSGSSRPSVKFARGAAR